MNLIGVLIALIVTTFFCSAATEQVTCGVSNLPIHCPDNPLGKWPWMASIGYLDNGTWTHQCGATLISNRHFLTTAYCTKNATMIHVGDFDLVKRQSGKDLHVIETFVHPKYKGYAYYDVAILETERVEYSHYIQPVCIPEEEQELDFYEQHGMQLIGWGSEALNGPSLPQLKRVTQVIHLYKHCNNTFDRKDEIWNTIKQAVPDLFTSTVLCAGDEVTNTGPCQGDSGGPLMLKQAGEYKYVQVALVHGAVGQCGSNNFPGIYVRLDNPEIIKFIQSVLDRTDQTEHDITDPEGNSPRDGLAQTTSQPHVTDLPGFTEQPMPAF